MDRVKHVLAGIPAQIKQLWKVLFVVYAIILLFFGVLDIVSRSSDEIPLSYFTRDITAVGDLPFFAGIVSQLGGLLWAASLAICIFTAFLLRTQGQRLLQPARRFLIQAAILTAVLLFDDIFLLHEDIGPDYLGISEKIIVLAYGVMALLFLLINRNEILSSEYLLLGLAFMMFGMSIFIDAAHLDKYDHFGSFFWEQSLIFFEDGFKFVGIITWLLYFARYAHQKIISIPNR